MTRRRSRLGQVLSAGAAVLLLVAAYLAVVGVGIYYRCKYDKEM